MRSGGADYRDEDRTEHMFRNIDFGIVWNVLQNDIPELEKALEPIVAAQPAPPELPDNLGEFI